ncbi:MAG: flippase [Acetatifactor sp.]|nr:flippase [Acetatifactor sp.]
MTTMYNNGLTKTIKNIFWMLFDKVFILLINLVLTVKVANHYGKSAYGTYQYALSIIALMEISLAFLDPRVLKKSYDCEDNGEIVWNATITRVVLSAVMLICNLIYCFITPEGREYKVLMMLLTVNSIVIGLRFGMANRYEYILQSRKTIISSNISITVAAVLQLIAISREMPIVAIAGINLFSSFICFLLIWKQYVNQFGRLKQGELKPEFIKSLLQQSFPLALATSCSIIYSRCDSVMIGNMLSKDDVGVYSLALKLIGIVLIGVGPIRESVYPKLLYLYEKDKAEYEKLYLQITSVMTWLYIAGVLVSFIILPYALLVLKPEYIEVFPIYRVYVLGTFFVYNAALRAGHFTMINRGSIMVTSTTLSMLLNVLLNLSCIYFWGLYGAAIATVVTQGASLMLSNVFFGKEGREVFKWQIRAINPKWMISIFFKN